MTDDGRLLVLLGLAGVAAGAAVRGSRGVARSSKRTPIPLTLREELIREIRSWIAIFEARGVGSRRPDVIRSMRSTISELEDDELLEGLEVRSPFDPWQLGQRIMGWTAKLSPGFTEQSSLLRDMMARGRDLEQRTREQGSADKLTPLLPLSVVVDHVPQMEQQGVSEVARSDRGFLTAYRRAGGELSRLSPEWRARREAFIARHMAQVRRREEPLWRDGEPTRRHLALIAWAYSPERERLESKGSRGIARAARALKPQTWVIAEKFLESGEWFQEGATDPLFWNRDPGGFVDFSSAERFTEADRQALASDYSVEHGFSRAARQVFGLPVGGVWQTEADARKRVERWNRVMRRSWP